MEHPNEDERFLSSSVSWKENQVRGKDHVTGFHFRESSCKENGICFHSLGCLRVLPRDPVVSIVLLKSMRCKNHEEEGLSSRFKIKDMRQHSSCFWFFLFFFSQDLSRASSK